LDLTEPIFVMEGYMNKAWNDVIKLADLGLAGLIVCTLITPIVFCIALVVIIKRAIIGRKRRYA
jgi:hypothetical protein